MIGNLEDPSFQYSEIRESRKHDQENDDLTDPQIIEYISKFNEDPKFIDFLSEYYNQHSFTNSNLIITHLVQYALQSDNYDIHIQTLLFTLFKTISNRDFGLKLIEKDLHKIVCEAFPSFSSLLLLREMIKSSLNIGEFVIQNTNFVEFFQNYELFSEKNPFAILCIDFLASFADHFDLYTPLFPIFPYYIHAMFTTSNILLLYNQIQNFSKFCYSFEITNAFINDQFFFDFMQRIIATKDALLIQYLFYIFQMMFTKNKYNILIEDDTKIHASDKLLASISLQLKLNIINLLIQFVNPEIDAITLEYSLKAINSLILPQTFSSIQQTNLYQSLKEIIVSDIIFSVKSSALRCLISMFLISDASFSLTMIEDGFMSFINDHCNDLPEDLYHDIINAILHYNQLGESIGDAFDTSIIYGETNIHEFLDDLVNSDSQLTDESGFPLSDIANSILQHNEDE